uniref:VWFA domain-containing protein n=1 Tax=Acrobeloides nanus TaxID=290746 RepID=A0A914C4X9_9BILA
MKSTLLVLSFLYIALHAAVVNRKFHQNLDTPTDTPPCSTNASSAYVDIILVIDTSANMGTSNLRKVCFWRYPTSSNGQFIQLGHFIQ